MIVIEPIGSENGSINYRTYNLVVGLIGMMYAQLLYVQTVIERMYGRKLIRLIYYDMCGRVFDNGYFIK